MEPVEGFLCCTRAPLQTPEEWQCDRDVNAFQCMAVATGRQCIQLKQHWDNCKAGKNPRDRKLSQMIAVKCWHRNRRNLGGLRAPPRSAGDVDAFLPRTCGDTPYLGRSKQ